MAKWSMITKYVLGNHLNSPPSLFQSSRFVTCMFYAIFKLLPKDLLYWLDDSRFIIRQHYGNQTRSNSDAIFLKFKQRAFLSDTFTADLLYIMQNMCIYIKSHKCTEKRMKISIKRTGKIKKYMLLHSLVEDCPELQLH